MEQKEKPQVSKASLFGVIGLVAFYICDFILYMGFSLGFLLLYKIPVINRLVDALFRARGDDPGFFSMFLAAVLSYSAVTWATHRFCDTIATESLSLKITGILLLILNIVFLIVNISAGESFANNIMMGIAGIIMIIRGANLKHKPDVD